MSNEKKLFDFVEIDENGYVKALYLSAEQAPTTGIFVKVEDNPYQYLTKQYKDGEWIDIPKQEEQVEPVSDSEQ